MENRYDKYKDSGIAWIGEIPEHWKITKIQYLAQLKSGYSLTTEEITDNGLYPVYGGNGIRGYYDKYFLEGDYVLIGRQGALCGNINYSTNKSWATEHAVVCYPKIKYVTRWFGELLRVMNLNQYSLAAAQPGLAVERIKLLPIPIIPLPEQQSIAAYLDQKCGEIDELITLQEEMITKLQSYKQSVITEAVTKGLNKNVPLKDSGIEWIGEIPEHWSIICLKRLCRISTGNQDTQDSIPDGKYPFFVRSPKVERSNNYTFEGPSILMAGDGVGAGKVFHLADNKFACHQRVYCINQFSVIVNRIYLFYYMSSLFYNIIDSANSKSTVDSVRLPMLAEFPVCIPLKYEQQSIADYLDQRCSEIDELISIKQQKIEKLKEYKKSLIFECVTGKRKVS